MKNVGQLGQNRLTPVGFAASQIWVLSLGKYLQARVSLSISRMVLVSCFMKLLCIPCRRVFWVHVLRWSVQNNICNNTAFIGCIRTDSTCKLWLLDGHKLLCSCLSSSVSSCCCLLTFLSRVFAVSEYTFWLSLSSGRCRMNNQQIIRDKIISPIRSADGTALSWETC